MSIDFYTLFNNPDKSCNINVIARIESIIERNDELIIVTLKNNKIEYKGITIIKGDIFPSPKKDNIIKVNKVHYKYDEYFKLRLYINAEIIDDTNFTIEENNILDILDFNENCINNTLKKFYKIDNELFTNLFMVDSSKESYSLKCLENNELFFLIKKNNLLDSCLNNKNIILINDYYLDKEKNIKLSPMSIIEKLSDEKLFILLENNEEISNKFL